MTDALIITAAIVGAETMRSQTPHVPYTPVEMGEESARCRDAGSSMVHVHGRLDDGTPTQDRTTFGRILSAIRERTDILVQFSTGGAVGMSVAERIEALDLRPDMATLTTGTVNFGDDVFLNSMPMIREIASALRDHGIRPEIEIFDTGMVDSALRLAREELLRLPAHFDFVLGVPGGMSASPENLSFLVSKLPEGCTWSVAGIGRHELPMAYQAIEMGGHVRVGLEDNIFLEKGRLAKGSYELVEKVAQRAEAAGRSIATPNLAREILHLSPGTPKE